MKFIELPLSVQTEVKSVLSAFDRVRVERVRETGELEVTNVVSLTAGESRTEFVSEYFAADIFTADERILNYVNSFREYPFRAGKDGAIHYTGKRDWAKLAGNWAEAVFEDGVIVFIGER